MNREQIIENVNSVISKVNSINLLNETFSVDKIDFFSKGRSAGLANFRLNLLKFNEVLAKENSESFMNTIIHEVAHLVAKKKYPNMKQHHGPEWKSVFIKLGGNGQTYHSYDISSVVKTKQFIYTCGCKDKELKISKIKHTRMSNNATVYHCVQCKHTIKFTGKEIN